MKGLFGLLIVAVGLAAAPVAAQDSDPAWAGVWKGTIGKYPIVACLDTSYREGEGRGSYYYLSQLKPIPLRTRDGKPGWTEIDSDFDEAASWVFSYVGHDKLEGEWSNGKRSHMLTLKPVQWQRKEKPLMPCEASAFMAPRLSGGEVVLEAGDTDGIAFIEHVYRNPAHLDISAQGFELMGDQPGDAAINQAVAQYRPTGTIKDDWVECLSGALAAHGRDGYFERTVRPSMLSDNFANVRISGSTYCGGAHPNHYSSNRLFDRQSGAEIKLESWFRPAGFAADEYGTVLITPALRAVVLKFANDDDPDQSECIDLARDHEWWDLALTRDGIVFTPDFPHIATACEDPIPVSWSALEPWLSKAGRVGKARLEPGVG